MTNPTTELILYRGRVQGVGFRYTVRRIATNHPVTGYVKNLPDGSVELVAQGSPEAINALLADVAQQFRGNITDCERRPAATAEVFSHFDIRF
jgi:acylphosphatase